MELAKKCNVSNMQQIRLSSSWFGEEEIAAVSRVLKSHIVSMGIETKLFEEELHKFWGRKDSGVTCVNSCSAALQLSLQASGIKRGDEVIVPTYTFVATFQAVTANGAIPIPCDVDLDDGFISMDDAKKRLTQKTRAIIPVLFAGIDSKIEKVYQFAEENKLIVIEDAAHCFGNQNIAKRDGILCFSFDPIKNISCGDGGCVLTSQNEVTERLKDIRLLGVIGDTDRRFQGLRSFEFDVVEQGWRLHMNNIAAAIGRVQLAKFHIIQEKRQKNANMYIENLSDIEGIRPLPINVKTAVPHIFPIIITNGKRDELKAFLSEKGIETGVQYKPNHLLSYFNRGYDLPNACNFYESILSIPVHPLLREDEVLYVIDCIKEFFYVTKNQIF
ncbi:MAG: DegT/DnrJ/EryC1/StrS family aminotransferase [Holosporales bacterium]|jgi:dTDP-4-amino-4,6-dideoxygalactose transaminase|nr:DegT/DnrJ/EryC1/StrS family aminotransferase [Holosporales bacterium]